MKTKQQATSSASQNDTRSHGGGKASLLSEFFGIAERARGEFKQERVFGRMMILALGMMCAFGRRTISQCILLVGGGQRDWSAWYRLFQGKRFREEDLAQRLLEEAMKDMPVGQPCVIGVDATHVPRSSKKMPGTGWSPAPGGPVWKRSLHLTQRFVTCAWFPPIVKGYTRAIVLRFLSAFTPKSSAASEDKRKDWEVARTFMTWMRQNLDAAGRKTQMLVTLGDGAYDRPEMWHALREGMVLITRTARNRILRYLPGPHVGRGRRALYGLRAPKPMDYVKTPKGRWQHSDIPVRGKTYNLRWMLRGCFLREKVSDQPVYLLVIGGSTRLSKSRGGKRVWREPVYFLINAIRVDDKWTLPLPITDILAWVWQRWGLEIAHREMKSNFGLGETQCWGQTSAILAVQWAAWLYGALSLAAYRLWRFDAGPTLRTRWWPGAHAWSFNTVLRGVRNEAFRIDDFRALYSGTTTTRPNSNAQWQLLRNGVLGSARI